MSDVDELAIRKILQEFEHNIVGVNRQNIGDIAGNIGRNDILKLGEVISVRRAKYLKAVMDMAGHKEDKFSIEMAKNLKSNRLHYEEAMQGFAALWHALERGYVVVHDA